MSNHVFEFALSQSCRLRGSSLKKRTSFWLRYWCGQGMLFVKNGHVITQWQIFCLNQLSPISYEVVFHISSGVIKQLNIIFYVSRSLYQLFMLKTKLGKYPRSIRFYLGAILVLEWMDWYSMAAKNMQPEYLLSVLGLLLSCLRIFVNIAIEQELRNFFWSGTTFCVYFLRRTTQTLNEILQDFLMEWEWNLINIFTPMTYFKIKMIQRFIVQIIFLFIYKQKITLAHMYSLWRVNFRAEVALRWRWRTTK
jgi:hypothetical protein